LQCTTLTEGLSSSPPSLPQLSLLLPPFPAFQLSICPTHPFSLLMLLPRPLPALTGSGYRGAGRCARQSTSSWCWLLGSCTGQGRGWQTQYVGFCFDNLGIQAYFPWMAVRGAVALYSCTGWQSLPSTGIWQALAAAKTAKAVCHPNCLYQLKHTQDVCLVWQTPRQLKLSTIQTVCTGLSSSTRQP
jgi:hypothetical protein